MEYWEWYEEEENAHVNTDKGLILPLLQALLMRDTEGNNKSVEV